MSEVRLDDKVVIVTGGSSGIGFAGAQELLLRGASVCLAARDESLLTRSAAHLEDSFPGRVAAVPTDVRSDTAVDSLFQYTLSRYGSVDGVLHAAGVLGAIGPVADCDVHGWRAVIDNNLTGTFLVGRAAARTMRAAGRGSIVFLSGGGATAAFPNFSAYGCSKAAVVRLAETLAVELAPYGVRVNSLAPGFVATRIHEQTFAAAEQAGAEYVKYTREQLERGGVPVELGARGAAFLLSDASAGITGRLLAVPWDDWTTWPDHVEELQSSDAFMLRRIVPRDRGADWQ